PATASGWMDRKGPWTFSRPPAASRSRVRPRPRRPSVPEVVADSVAPVFVARSVLADQVRERLLEGILSGRYPPDARIVETQVARELGTSQAPVREALRGLQALGLVEITPFRGARVRRPTTQEL